MSNFESTLRKTLERIGGWSSPSWVLGLIIGALAWQVGFVQPYSGLDPSWWGGLYMAAHGKMQFGTEIVFTYGPLGFLRYPWLFYPGALALLAFAYAVALYLGLCITMVAVLRRRVTLALAFLITLLVVLFLDWIEVSVALSVLLSMLIIERRPSDRNMLLIAVAGGVFAGAEMLIKLSSGPVIVLVLLLALFAARAKGRDIAAYLISLVASMIGFWLVTGQSLGNLPDFTSNSIQIIAGYNQAMSIYERSDLFAVVIGAAGVVCVAWAFWGRYPDRRTRLLTGALVLIVTFAYYKQAVVRMDKAHVAIFLALAALVWVAIPPRRGLAPISIAGLALTAVVSISVVGGTSGSSADVIENVKKMTREVRTALSPSRQRYFISWSRAFLQQDLQIDERLRAELEGHRVSVDPWEVSAVWAYEYDWSPAPVFQNYSAYTTKLDQLNSETISSDDGPDRILRHTGGDPAGPSLGVDGRFLAWDPPAQAVATLCNFRTLDQAGGWQVLARVPDRCGPMVPAGEVSASFGEVVDVPRPGPNEVVLAKIEGVEFSPVESLESLLFRPSERRATVGSDSYRLIAETAKDGLMLRMGPNIAEGRGKFAQAPQEPTIAVTGGSGDLKYEFFRFKVKPEVEKRVDRGKRLEAVGG